MVEQAAQATLGAYGSWSHLSAILIGRGLENEADFLSRKGIKEEQLRFLPYTELIASQSEKKDDIIWIQIPPEAEEGQNYEAYLKLMKELRDDSDKARVIVVESGILGFSTNPNYGDPEISLKQVYLQVLDYLEEKLGDRYVKIHDQLIQEIRDDDYEKRLVFLFQHKDLADCWKDDVALKLMEQAQARTLVANHSSKTFEAGFIAGQEDELEQLLKQLKPKMDWESFKSKHSQDDNEQLRYLKISDKQIDPELAENRCRIWNELEILAGKQFDYLCNKTFNKYSNVKKYQLTGDDRFEDDDELEIDDQQEPDITSNFRKFQVDDNPLSALMGNSGLGGNLMGGAGGSPLGGAQSPAMPLPSAKKVSLEEYGEVFLAMVSAWIRNRVTVGGALFEYSFQSDESLQVGSVIALSTDSKLQDMVINFGKAMGLGGKKANPDELLKIFFDFNNNYIKFYDKVRNQLKASYDQYIGSITQAEYEEEAKHQADLESKIKVDMKARKERDKKLSNLSKSSHKARIELLKKLKEDSKPKGEQQGESSDTSTEVELAALQMSLTEDEIQELNQRLEERRMMLEEKIEMDRMKREELEEAILKEKEIREQKRLELEKQRQKKAEAEKADFNRRQQRLAEERKKREEVKKMRAKSLREAFDRAREAAIRKQGSKGTAVEENKDDKKAEKKKYNPEAVKMMIRFGTDDNKIMSTTGISGDDLVDLKEEVANEDKNL
jgi:hypothetical protein